MSLRTGFSTEHLSIFFVQFKWNGQPEGRLMGEGISPVKGIRFCRFDGSVSGIAAIRA